jgi:hypothetical protein
VIAVIWMCRVANSLSLPSWLKEKIPLRSAGLSIAAFYNSDRTALLAIPGVIRGDVAITSSTANSEALRTMKKYGLDAIPAVDESRQGLTVADRNHIETQMLLALAGAGKW